VIFLYIVLGVAACAVLGKLMSRRTATSQQITNELDDGTRRRLRPSPAFLDTEENPRNLDDGTSFGYREGD
jgi:hypothetical protein